MNPGFDVGRHQGQKRLPHDERADMMIWEIQPLPSSPKRQLPQHARRGDLSDANQTVGIDPFNPCEWDFVLSRVDCQSLSAKAGLKWTRAPVAGDDEDPDHDRVNQRGPSVKSLCE